MDIARKRARLGESAAHFRRWGTPSPDGRWILFVHVYPHSRYVSPPIDLWVTGIDGRYVRRLVEPTPNGPSYTWTPDGLVSVADKAGARLLDQHDGTTIRRARTYRGGVAAGRKAARHDRARPGRFTGVFDGNNAVRVTNRC